MSVRSTTTTARSIHVQGHVWLIMDLMDGGTLQELSKNTDLTQEIIGIDAGGPYVFILFAGF